MGPTENVKKANRPRYWLTFLLKDLVVGETFKPDVLHLTIIPWFVTDLPDEEVIRSFQEYFSGLKILKIRVGEPAEFKSRRKIPINLISKSSELSALHKKALAWFAELEARWAVQSPHVDQEFVPHIRRRKGHNVAESDVLTFTSLSLVRAFRRGDDLRTVAAKVELNEA